MSIKSPQSVAFVMLTRHYFNCLPDTVPLLSRMLFLAWVYIMTNRSQSVLYAGYTNDLFSRIWEHATKQSHKSFTARYNVNRLVYYQGFLSVAEAEKAEMFIKKKTRAWKRSLISKHNPTWKDLSAEVKAMFY